MMYTPDAFSGRPAALTELLAAHPFATLITPQADGEPWISHLVLLADPEQPDCLLGHLARATPRVKVAAVTQFGVGRGDGGPGDVECIGQCALAG